MSEMVERVAEAIEDERDRWIGRTNKMRDDAKFYEVCRVDDSGEAGSFSEIHAFAGYAESERFRLDMIAERSAIAAIRAMRKADQSMSWAGARHINGTNAGSRAYIVWEAMIDAALPQGTPNDR